MYRGTPSEDETAASTMSECPTNPERRATEHRKRGKQGKMKVETRGMSRKKARSWESRRLNIFRQNHSGKNPPLNKSRDGGFQ